MVRRRGGLGGSALSDLARHRTRAEIEQKLTATRASVTPGYQMASVRLRDGREVRGFLRNESSYEIELQTVDGRVASLGREQVVEVTREERSSMPSLQASEVERRAPLACLPPPASAPRP